MVLTLNGFIDYLTETIKQNQTGPVECTWCNNSANIIKYGTYHRYAFTGGELIPIQRYLCKHELCKRTFSILPHPFLRITRFSLCIFRILLIMIQQKIPVSQIAFNSNVNFSTSCRKTNSFGPTARLQPSSLRPHVNGSIATTTAGLTALENKARFDKGSHNVPKQISDAMWTQRQLHPRWTVALTLDTLIHKACGTAQGPAIRSLPLCKGQQPHARSSFVLKGHLSYICL